MFNRCAARYGLLLGLLALGSQPVWSMTLPDAPQADSDIVEVTKANINEVLTHSAQKPLVLYFGAWYCGPCHKWKAKLKEMNAADKGSWTLGLIDAAGDKDQAIALQYEVYVVPKMMAFRDGKPVSQQSPLNTVEGVKGWLQTFLAGQVPAPLPED